MKAWLKHLNKGTLLDLIKTQNYIIDSFNLHYSCNELRCF